MKISVLGAGAFGTSLAIALAKTDKHVSLWCREIYAAQTMQTSRMSGRRLPGHELPETLTVTAEMPKSDIALIAVPTQKLAAFLDEHAVDAQALVACCKGVDLQTGLGPVATLLQNRSNATAAMLTGPSFAEDIAAGLPTALVLATEDETAASELQSCLTRPALRLYRTTDVTGAELGGALKNVIALAAGMTIGAGLGDSARASVIARGFSEMGRYVQSCGGKQDTLNGLSGLGDLVLTCTSEKSRNFTAGMCLGKGEAPEQLTIEGLSTAVAVSKDANKRSLDLPIIDTVASVVSGRLDINQAIATLMARPVGKE